MTLIANCVEFFFSLSGKMFSENTEYFRMMCTNSTFRESSYSIGDEIIRKRILDFVIFLATFHREIF